MITKQCRLKCPICGHDEYRIISANETPCKQLIRVEKRCYGCGHTYYEVFNYTGYKETTFDTSESSIIPQELLNPEYWTVESAQLLINWIIKNWRWEDYANYDPVEKKLTLITGGWSEHEQMLEELKTGSVLNFWMMFWESSIRGGKHIFDVSRLPFTKESEE